VKCSQQHELELEMQAKQLHRSCSGTSKTRNPP